MKLLETYENKKGNKLIFRQRTSDIPSLGSIVVIEKENPKGSHSKEKKFSDIGKIIDIFGPVKEPWVVVNLFKDKELHYQNLEFFWKKEQNFKNKGPKDFKKNRKRTKDWEN